MRIYQVNTEHVVVGRNYSSYKIAARTCEEAIAKAKKEFMPAERLESVELLASED
jgi:hypothetical protein